MTLETLRSLQTRIREATGHDRELDRAITTLFYSFAKPPIPFTTYPDGLGACVALIEHLWPGHFWYVARGKTRPDEPMYAASLHDPIADDGGVIAEHEYGATHALLLAICAAKIAELEAELNKEISNA